LRLGKLFNFCPVLSPKHLKILKRDVEKWNKWKLKKKGHYALFHVPGHDLDLSEADLSEADLSNLFLNGADFSRMDLRCVNFSKSQLATCNFTEAHLEGANLSGTNLGGANLYKTELGMAKPYRVFETGTKGGEHLDHVGSATLEKSITVPCKSPTCESHGG
jgi:hypothetical protein